MKNKLLSVFISILIILLCFAPVISAGASPESISAEGIIKEFLKSDGRIIGISSKGEWDEYPENSLPAVKTAADTGIDMVLVDVKETSDGVLILFSDESTERMLASETAFIISETTYSELSEYKLKASCGGSNAEESEYTIPRFDDVLSFASENDIALAVRCEAELIPQVSEALTEYDMLGSVIIFTESDISDIRAALEGCNNKPYVAGTKKGNVIFVISSFISKLSDIGCAGAVLKTTNRYGINFYPSLLSSYSEKVRIIADPTVPEDCGARTDCEMWWDDLISRGYSVIITDHAEIFTDYLKDIDEARHQLSVLYDRLVTKNTLPDFRDEALNDMKKAYTDAVSEADRLLADKSSAAKELTACYASLSKAANDISINFASLEDGSAGTSVTLPRILLCIAFAVIVVIVQAYFYKKRKKEG